MTASSAGPRNQDTLDTHLIHGVDIRASIDQIPAQHGVVERSGVMKRGAILHDDHTVELVNEPSEGPCRKGLA